MFNLHLSPQSRFHAGVGALAVAVFLGCAGCAAPAVTASHQPTLPRETRCLGTVDHKTCMETAIQLCRTGFDVYEKEAPAEEGVVRRGLYFRCKP